MFVGTFFLPVKIKWKGLLPKRVEEAVVKEGVRGRNALKRSFVEWQLLAGKHQKYYISVLL